MIRYNCLPLSMESKIITTICTENLLFHYNESSDTVLMAIFPITLADSYYFRINVQIS